MKRYMLSLICALAASAAWAQSPVPENYRPIPIGSNTSPTSVVAAPTTSAPAAPSPTSAAASAAAPTTGTATGAHGAACDAGCVKLKTVCVPQPATVTKTKVLFSSGCDTICLCSLFGKRGGDCDSCNGNCGRPKTVKSLYKRVETTTCESTKCVPVQVPACATGACPTSCASGQCVAGATAASQAASTAPAQQVMPASARPTLGFAEMTR